MERSRAFADRKQSWMKMNEAATKEKRREREKERNKLNENTKAALTMFNEMKKTNSRYRLIFASLYLIAGWLAAAAADAAASCLHLHLFWFAKQEPSGEEGWIDGWMHACMHGWLDRWMDGEAETIRTYFTTCNSIDRAFRFYLDDSVFQFRLIFIVHTHSVR